MLEPLAYLNGQFLPASQAAIAVYDAGFVLGATASEQLRTFGGRLFQLDKHLARFRHTLEVMGIDPGLSASEFGAIAAKLIANNRSVLASGDDLGFAIFVTPGPYATLAPVEATGPTVGMHTYPLPFGLWAEKYERGESLVVSSFEQVSSRSWPAEIKCRSRLHYYLAEREARQIQPGARALLVDADGHITETMTSNVLIYRPSEGLISPRQNKILAGISLAMIGELSAGMKIQFSERDVTADDLATADEILLTSTPSGLLAATRFNGKPVGSGKPGPIYARLLAAWSDAVGVDIAQQAREFATRSRTANHEESP